MINFSKPQKFTTMVKNKVLLNQKVARLDLELLNPKEIYFQAGQFISLKVSETAYRSYSISSSMFEHNNLSIIVGIGHDGVGSNYVKNLQIEDTVEFVGPSGRFVLPENSKKNLVFIATGTGISPMLSMIDSLLKNSTDSNVSLVFGIRDKSELFLEKHIQTLKSSHKNFDYKICFSQETPSDVLNAYNGRVTENINFTETAFSQYFICGNPYMVQDTIKLLIEKGVKEEDIFHEKFTVSSPIKPN